MDTIFALATAQGRAGVAVVRISGAAAKAVATQLCSDLPASRGMATRILRRSDGQVLDHALVLVFDAPRSFTGEDVVELHLHGSIAVVSAVLRELSKTDARLAEPGEFTRRALENNKMDLAQVEGLGDLIEAETEAQRLQALRTVSGELGQRIEVWRSLLIRAAALIEVTIDFADEDVPVDVTPEVLDLLKQVTEDVDDQLQGFASAERIRTGFEVAIVGAPNAGKSTLLNTLAKRDAAITSDIAGTTRDVIEVRMDLGGLPVTLLDTAGLRDTGDRLEAEGIARAFSRAKDADLRVFLIEPGEDLGVLVQDGDVVRAPKADIRRDAVPSVSGLSGHGVDTLVKEVTQALLSRSQSAGLATHERHRSAMENALSDLSSASVLVAAGPDQYEIAADQMRIAIRSLEAVVGRVDVENLLDEIFSSFCLGK
ncbi:tRNA uridine-5-carboxymethylaminomethyl(34) synthesis GTPase MnmE [Tateyamaria sp. ANG-S1]|uniref:tRNA uridine-5-carboxymethylaminomethyl(34) synthesis GTPase MnmE n=1 Tax=Tateyamaria sp. ANG-S1 TaxID=1577905 RepID=UPI00057DA6EC|nr:tRNA uridine-5-carboxymethylaminomethyl(34) synthesis GTPase MnmE [Tateyamaria sp. ANG-S1]KIC49791.1 tRNA modification GTPase TrmE [Tateyamaria sp. ANG-S1]